MFIVLKELVIFFLSLLFLLLALEIFEKIIDELIVDPDHVLLDPSIHWPLLLQVVHIVLNRLSRPHMGNSCHFVILILR